MNNIASELNNGLGALKVLYDFGKIGLTKAKTRFTTPLRVEKLADEVFLGNVKYNSVVTVTGVLSKFGTTYRPSTYAPVIPAQASDKPTGFKIDLKQKKLLQEHTTTATFKTFQFPVQTLPKFQNETEEAKGTPLIY